MKNPYKISTVLLLLTLIGVVIYYHNQVDREPKHSANFMDEIPQDKLIEFLDFINVGNDFDKKWLSSDLDSMSGKPLPLETAQLKRREFDKWNDIGVRKLIRPYGFFFGKHRLREMLRDIDQINSVSSKEEIIGIRAYLTRTYSTSFNGRLKNHLDLQFIPVGTDGKDYLNYSNHVEILGDSIDMLLNTSAPCPNNCQN